MKVVKSQVSKVKSTSFPRSAWERDASTLCVECAASWPQSGRILRSHAERGNEGSRPSRHGFTLIELLIVITILGILASLVVGIAMVAGQTGREGKTRNMVERIHTLLVDHHSGFKSRRVELNQVVTNAIANLPVSYTSADRGRITAAARLFALREMMLLEMPDRWSDLWLQPLPPPPTSVTLTGLTTSALSPAYLVERTALSENFLRRFRSLYGRENSLTQQANTLEEIMANQSAECLYMVVTVACGDGEARTQFHESDIGDTDGDGAPEFLDGWGHPISFLRWAPGFTSPVQLSVGRLAEIRAEAIAKGLDGNQAVANEIAKDHDPFDLFRLHPYAHRLMPLVYSAGRDERLGVDPFVNYVAWLPQPSTNVYSFVSAYPYINPRLDPYDPINISLLPAPLGSDIGEGESTDNIHNHLIGRRL
ncbi:MAG: prepilin-type N-terminal cleavage/methylation domain-containing protein [Pirellulales bacterium]